MRRLLAAGTLAVGGTGAAAVSGVLPTQAQQTAHELFGAPAPKLAAARSVNVETRFSYPARDLGRQERLARVVHLCAAADSSELPVEGVADAAGSRPDIRLVYDIEGRAELGDEGAGGHPCDLEFAARPVPSAFWQALRDRGLIASSAPLPGTRS